MPRSESSRKESRRVTRSQANGAGYSRARQVREAPVEMEVEQVGPEVQLVPYDPVIAQAQLSNQPVIQVLVPVLHNHIHLPAVRDLAHAQELLTENQILELRDNEISVEMGQNLATSNFIQRRDIELDTERHQNRTRRVEIAATGVLQLLPHNSALVHVPGQHP